jgi:hypothetical protein
MDKRNSLQRHPRRRWLSAFSLVRLVAVVALSLCSSATSFAQGNGAGNGAAQGNGAQSNGADSKPSRDLSFGDHVVVGERPSERPDRAPSSGGHDRIDRGGVGAGTGGATGTTPDPYPALTAANNAYKEALAEWQRAEAHFASTRAHYMRMREKYCDETGEVRRGPDWGSATLVVKQAQKELTLAEDDLGKATKARNGAHGNAVRAFRAATEQFQRAEQARVAEQERQRRESAQQQRYDRRGDRGR